MDSIFEENEIPYEDRTDTANLKFGQWLSSPRPGDEVVMSGMAGRFPESNNVHEYRDNLMNKRDMITGDGRRWVLEHPEIPQRGGRVPVIDKLDAGFFGLHFREANIMDPKMRCFLETAVECVLDAGFHPSELAGTRTGVFIGDTYSDSETKELGTLREPQSFGLPGYLKSVTAHRVSYLFKFKGPSFVIDSACSSSLNAMEHAFRAIRTGQCDKALVGGINLILHPGSTLQFYRLGVLSTDGSCKVFDEQANGYVRSETVGCIFLQKARDARRIYGQVVYGKINCDGYKEQGITFPSSQMQRFLLNECLEDTGIHPNELSFVEAHGTGTKVGDPQEVEAIDKVMAQPRDHTLLVGSVKCQIGHTEPASGIGSVVKIAIAMETGIIPPNIRYKNHKKEMEGFNSGRLKVVTEQTPLEGANPLIGVNSFGFGGNNCHILMRRVAKKKTAPLDNIPRLVCVSGRTRLAVEEILSDLKSRQVDHEYIGLLHNVFRENIRTHIYRGYAIMGQDGNVTTSIRKSKEEVTQLYVYFGDLSQSHQVIGRYLMEFPLFRKSIARITDILSTKKANVNVLDSPLGPLAVQIGIADLLKSLKINPQHLQGNATGKFVCAYLRKEITLRETLMVAARGHLDDKMEDMIRDMDKIHKMDELDGICSNYNSVIKTPKKSLVLNISDEKVGGIRLYNAGGKTVQLLEMIGSAYQHGHNPQLANLFPPVHYPVSRGTPMISPLIKWDHDRTWRTYKFSEFVGSDAEQQEHILFATDVDNAYITGHMIDGRNLFPATGYLYLVWLTLAQSRRISPTDISIVFENCRFVRAVTFPRTGTLVLIASVQADNGRFEVIENNTCVVTGNVFITNEVSLLEMDEPLDEPDPTDVIDMDDIYKELNLRGYNYTGMFRGVTQCNIDATKGFVKWEDNYVTFMDKMLQLKILQIDTRLLYVPVGIDRLSIDSVKHLTMLQEMEEAQEAEWDLEGANQRFTKAEKSDAAKKDMLFPVHVNREANTVRCGGIEIRGLHARSIPRKRPTAEPVLEKYQFVPNVTDLPLQDSLRVNIQMILENTLEVSVKAVEIIDDHTVEDTEPLMGQIATILGDIPLIKPDLTISSKRTLEPVQGVKLEDVVLTPKSAYLLLIGSKIFQRANIITAVKDNGFVLTREQLDYDPPQVNGIDVVTLHTTPLERIFLLRRSVTPDEQVVTVEISSEVSSWLPELKSHVTADRSVLLYNNSSEGEASGILGLVNCIRREPGGQRVRCFFAMDEGAPPFDPLHEFYSGQDAKHLAVNVFRNNTWGTYRHLLLEDLALIDTEHSYANIGVRGDLTSFKWFQGNLDHASSLPEGQTLVSVYYAAINFRDVMTASGRINADVISMNRIYQECVQGFEFAGRRNSDGKRVMGVLTSKAMATVLAAHDQILWDVPDHWSLQDAATVPVVYLTLIYGLMVRTTLRKGESILIHSATGGIGLAALNMATYWDLDIYVTVGTQEKRDYLRRHYPNVRDSHIGSSRDTSFEQMIRKETQGRGVDLVLNSLAEEKLRASVRCLALGGRFVEIGKFDLANNSSLQMMLLQREASFHGITLDVIYEMEAMARLVTALMVEGIELGYVKPLPQVVFLEDEVEKAFRFMGQGVHIGKVMVKIREEEPELIVRPTSRLIKGVPRFWAKPDKSYVIVGGLGGFGMELADWLMLHGAKKLVLSSRHGIQTGYQKQRIRIWETYYDVKVHVSTADVTTRAGCQKLIQEAKALGPLDAIFNLGVVLRDNILENQTEENFATSFGPKATATRFLDEITRETCVEELRHFVVFSSVSCGRGNAGQTNYGMSNSIMERICEKRKKDGLPALAVQWGAVGDVGLVAKMQKDHKILEIGGTLQQKVANCLDMLHKFLNQTHPIVASMVVAEKRSGSTAGSAAEAVCHILGIKDLKTISLHSTLPELGMDSITGTEIVQTLERDFEIYLNAKDMRAMTFHKLLELEAEKKLREDEDKSAHKALKSMIFSHLPDDEEYQTPIQVIDNKIDEGPLVFVLPGIDGLIKTMDPLTCCLKARVIGLRYNYKNPEGEIRQMVDYILPYVEEQLDQGPFYVMGYSFGVMIAMELNRRLQQRGNNRGKVVAIEGGPAYFSAGIKAALGQDTEIETNLICFLLSQFIPIGTILESRPKIALCKTFRERCDAALALIPETLPNRDRMTHRAGFAYYQRVRATMDYRADKETRIRSDVILYKAASGIVGGVPDDYQLGELFDGTIRIVTVAESDHLTILSRPELAEDINKMLLSE